MRKCCNFKRCVLYSDSQKYSKSLYINRNVANMPVTLEFFSYSIKFYVLVAIYSMRAKFTRRENLNKI